MQSPRKELGNDLSNARLSRTGSRIYKFRKRAAIVLACAAYFCSPDAGYGCFLPGGKRGRACDLLDILILQRTHTAKGSRSRLSHSGVFVYGAQLADS